jgi:exopolysaccharide production protein ExoY
MRSRHDDLPHALLFDGCDIPLPRWKRALDLAGCAAALPLLGIGLALMWLWTRLTSRGPVFFRQERIGYRGRPFTMYKFRTMRHGADAAAHQSHVAALVRNNVPMQKMDAGGDPRLIPGGWLLRASGLDELPQILNVLKGDMSLVGPRPCVPYEYSQYTPWHRRRFNAVPGLTGLWQVAGKNRMTFEEMVRLDIRYAQRKSLRLDLKIIALTLPALCVQIADTRLLRRSAPATRSPTAGATLQT